MPRPLLLVAILLFPSCARRALPEHGAFVSADVLLRNGRIVTLDGGRPEVRAIALQDDRVLALGSEGELERYVDPHTVVIDLAGALAVPGLIDGHAHLLGIGDMRLQLDLRGAKTWEEIVAQVAQAAQSAPKGEWIRGRGWHQEKWEHAPEGALDGWPTNEALNRAAPDNPVVLEHASGHAAIVNAKALEIAGVSALGSDPPGGKILRDAAGRPTGVLNEAAQELVHRASDADPAARKALIRRKVELAAAECLSKGITSFQDAGSSLEAVEVYREMARAGELPLRLWVMLSEPNEVLGDKLAEAKTIGEARGFLTVRAIKRYMDGALGSRGAWMLAPYSDLPSTSGLNTSGLGYLAESAALARNTGFQLCVHAIGDRGNRETLDLFEHALGPDARTLDRRWRIEHAQHLDPADIPRFAQLGVIASMQGIHCTSDGPWVPTRIGEERAKNGAYVWHSLLASGAVVSNGTDAPVEDVDPLPCFYASVTRRLKDGTRFHPEQCMTRMEALRSYTFAPAYAAFEEDVKGSLTVGKYADITVIDKDILAIPEDEIPKARVVLTIVAGKVAWRAAGR